MRRVLRVQGIVRINYGLDVRNGLDFVGDRFLRGAMYSEKLWRKIMSSRILIVAYDSREFDGVPEDGVDRQKFLFDVDGEVIIHAGSPAFLREKLETVPQDMELIVIEKKRRKQRAVTQASVTPTGKIRFLYSDGTEELFRDQKDIDAELAKLKEDQLAAEKAMREKLQRHVEENVCPICMADGLKELAVSIDNANVTYTCMSCDASFEIEPEEEVEESKD